MIARLVRNELAKALRTKLPYLGMGAVCLVCTLVFVFTGTIPGSEHQSAWDFISFAMQAGFADIGLIFIVIFSALLISEENGSGTLAAMLCQPVRRIEYYTAKLITGLLYMASLYVAALATCLALAATRYSFGPVADSSGEIYSAREAVANLAAAFFLSWLPGIAAVSFGLLLSSVSKKGGPTVGAAVGILILTESVKHVVDIGPFVFTTYLGAPWVVFHEVAQGVSYQWFPTAWGVIVVPLVSAAVFLSASAAVFCRRDIHR